jgi:AcrR family transcriptional regulator
MELYVERGFEETTVAEIAGRAGLTARTFFRHFADKREVLFAGSSELQDALVAALAAAPATANPMQAVAVALEAAAGLLGQNREHSRQRQAVINSRAELRERELIKLASLADALADALRRRGVPDPDASLAAESGVVVFRVAFERWTQPAEKRGDEAERASSADQSGKADADDDAERSDRAAGSDSAESGHRAAGSDNTETGDQRGEAGATLARMMRDALERLAGVTAGAPATGQGSMSAPTA